MRLKMAKPKKDFSASAKKAPKDKKLPDLTGMLVPTVRDKDGMGHDIFSFVLKNRKIFIFGQVNTELAATVIAQIKHLEKEDPKEQISVWINSPGGSVIDGLAIVDVLRECKCPIQTVGMGMQASMGSVFLAAGDTRVMTQNSEVLVHQIMGGAEGGTQHSDFEINAAHMARLHEKLKSVYVKSTGLNHRFWDKVGERDTWLTADQALKIGFINHVVKNEKPDLPYEEDAVRPESQRDETEIAKLKKIAGMSREQIVEALNNGNANSGEWGRYRPDLVVRLAEFPEYWTKKKCIENGIDPETLKPLAQAVAAAGSAANDDSAKSERKARKPRGPSHTG
jgi:ATP-dependent Clp protease protease subunit